MPEYVELEKPAQYGFRALGTGVLPRQTAKISMFRANEALRYGKNLKIS